MRKLILVLVSAAVGSIATAIVLEPRASAIGGQGGGVAACSTKSGDVNADGAVDISDAVAILGNLFLGAPTELAPLCASARGLPDTGQTQCYDCSGQLVGCLNCTGRPRPCDGFTDPKLSLQDAMQSTGCPNDANRFTANGDGTVTDHCTGLMWQKDTADVNATGSDNISWCDALRYCDRLEFAGHDDWRLPNVRELLSIVDYAREDPSTDPVFGGASSGLWSSTSIASNPTLAWYVFFINGDVDYFDKLNELFVRAVRTVR